jgi:hypothetical protein
MKECNICGDLLCDGCVLPEEPPVPRVSSARRVHLKYKFGVDQDWYNDKLREQGGKCAICGTHEHEGRRRHFSIDHDHVTGKCLALLCQSCNKLLGQAKENTDILRAAIDYLRKHEKTPK